MYFFSFSVVQRRFGPLVVIFVGLPGRGKTVLAHKLERYLTWTNKIAKGKNFTIIF